MVTSEMARPVALLTEKHWTGVSRILRRLMVGRSFQGVGIEEFGLGLAPPLLPSPSHHFAPLPLSSVSAGTVITGNVGS